MLLRQAIAFADAELAVHQEVQAAGDAHAPARQMLVDMLQPPQQAQERQRR